MLRTIKKSTTELRKSATEFGKKASGWGKELQGNPCYLVGAIVFLSLFLRISNPLFFNNLFSFLIITFLLNLGFKDWSKSILFSAIIVVIMNLVLSFGYSQEGYENLDDALKKLRELGDMKHKSDDDADDKPKTTDGETKAVGGSEKKDQKGVPVVTLNGKKQQMEKFVGKKQQMEEFNQLSDQEKGKLLKNLNQGEQVVKRESAVAQRDLFQLIDTVKQLQSTVEELGPTLKEGKKIMDAFENIKMD